MILPFAFMQYPPKREERASVHASTSALLPRNENFRTVTLVQVGIWRGKNPHSPCDRGQMLLPQVALHAPSPRAHKGKIQDSTDRRTGHWNHTPNPFLGGFFA